MSRGFLWIQDWKLGSLLLTFWLSITFLTFRFFVVGHLLTLLLYSSAKIVPAVGFDEETEDDLPFKVVRMKL